MKLFGDGDNIDKDDCIVLVVLTSGFAQAYHLLQLAARTATPQKICVRRKRCCLKMLKNLFEGLFAPVLGERILCMRAESTINVTLTTF